MSGLFLPKDVRNTAYLPNVAGALVSRLNPHTLNSAGQRSGNRTTEVASLTVTIETADPYTLAFRLVPGP